MPQQFEDPLKDINITPEDVEAVKPTLDFLEVAWWNKDRYQRALAGIYALGRQSQEKKDNGNASSDH